MTRKIRATKVELILSRASTLATETKASAWESIQAACREHKAGDPERTLIQDAFAEALVSVDIGQGVDFQRAIVDRAHRIVQMGQRGSKVPGLPRTKRPASVGKGRERVMSESIENTESTEVIIEDDAGRKKKYRHGDTYQLVATMGLQATKEDDNPDYPYQFSRKTGRPGAIDIPEGTDMTYIGAYPVYPDKPHTKRMIFKVAPGTPAFLDGEDIELDEEIKIAGVVNHIEYDDPYNVDKREKDAAKLEKAQEAATEAA